MDKRALIIELKVADLEKEKAAQFEAAKAELKCPKCGNEQIKEYHNYCIICGNQLKEKPIIIDFHP